jgi:hypothetical protein
MAVRTIPKADDRRGVKPDANSIANSYARHLEAIGNAANQNKLALFYGSINV